jgi:hypothetical protein
MTIHRFAVDTGQINPGVFDSVWESYRSETEQRHTKIAIHDTEVADIKLARQLADEIIHVSGAEIKVFLRTDNADHDDVFDEDADPTYWNPMPMKAFFKPAAIEIELKKWGADMETHRTEVSFSHRQLYTKFGNRMLRSGDVLQLPYNAAAISPKNFRIINATPSGNFRYIWLYYTCQVEVLTADITVRTEEDMPQEESLKTGGVYRESI